MRNVTEVTIERIAYRDQGSPKRTRISCYVALTSIHVCGFR
jgi:hypothetical protein